jgi:hypothetical protein
VTGTGLWRFRLLDARLLPFQLKLLEQCGPLLLGLGLRWRGNQRIAGHVRWGLLVLSGKAEHQAEGENTTHGQPYEGLSDGFHGFSIRWFDFLRAFLPGLEPPATPGKMKARH